MPRLALWFLAPFIAGAWALAAGAALAQYLDEPSPVPGGLNEPCQLELQAQRDSIESERLRLDPLVGAFEAECGNVATDDADAMASCQEREAALGGEVDAYFARLGDYEKRTAGAPERQRLDKAIAAKRAELAKAEVLIPKLKAEIEAATGRTESVGRAIEDWTEKATEARNQAVEDALMLVSGEMLEHVAAKKEQARKEVIDRFIETTEALNERARQLDPAQFEGLIREVEAMPKAFSSVVSDQEIVTKVKKLHQITTGAGAALDLQTREKAYRGIIDVLGMIGGPATQRFADFAKLVESTGYWALVSYFGSDTMDALDTAQGINAKAIDAIAKRYAKAVDARKAAAAELTALEGQRAAIPYGCAGMV